jgi:predicted RNA binding protein YcfA (HicA-like mRNA interferase family)
MKGYGKVVREMLADAGCAFIRHGKGDHDIWRTKNGKSITVPVKIMSRHTANAILKDAGLPKAF